MLFRFRFHIPQQFLFRLQILSESRVDRLFVLERGGDIVSEAHDSEPLAIALDILAADDAAK